MSMTALTNKQTEHVTEFEKLWSAPDAIDKIDFMYICACESNSYDALTPNQRCDMAHFQIELKKFVEATLQNRNSQS